MVWDAAARGGVGHQVPSLTISPSLAVHVEHHILGPTFPDLERYLILGADDVADLVLVDLDPVYELAQCDADATGSLT